MATRLHICRVSRTGLVLPILYRPSEYFSGLTLRRASRQTSVQCCLRPCSGLQAGSWAHRRDATRPAQNLIAGRVNVAGSPPHECSGHYSFAARITIADPRWKSPVNGLAAIKSGARCSAAHDRRRTRSFISGAIAAARRYRHHRQSASSQTRWSS